MAIIEWIEITNELLDTIEWLRGLLVECENNAMNIVGAYCIRPVQVFPNPVTNELQITTDNLQIGEMIELFDMNGRRVFSQRVASTLRQAQRPSATGRSFPELVEGNVFTIDMSAFQQGNYILRIGTRVAKIVKQ